MDALHDSSAASVAEPRPMRHVGAADCPLCSARGHMVFEALPDRLFGVPGRWNIRHCDGPECGVLWLDPVPVPDDLHLAYREYATHGYRRHGGGGSHQSALRTLYIEAQRAHLAERLGYEAPSGSLRRRILRRSLRAWPARADCAESEALHLPAHPGARLLDIGCGDGRSVAWLRSLGWDAEGIDFDEAAVAAARAQGLPVRQGDLRSLAFQPGSFDAVTVSHVIEHVHDPGSLVADCYRILRPGGRLVIVTPNSNSYLARRYKRNWIALDPPRHLMVFTVRALSRLVREAGFSEERVFTSPNGANCAAVAARAFKRHDAHNVLMPVKKSDRVVAELVQQAEWFQLKRDWAAGEEIVVVARRS